VKSRKIYAEVNPEILYDEVKDFVQKQGLILDEAGLQTYSVPGGSSHVVRGTLIFKREGDGGEGQCFRAHIVGSAVGETRLMIDVDDSILSAEKIAAIQEDLDFIFGAYEVKP